MNAPSCGTGNSTLCVADLKGLAAPEDPTMLADQPENRTVLGVTFHAYEKQELFEADNYPSFIST